MQPIDVRTLRKRFHPRFLSYVRAVAPLLWMFAITAVWQFPSRAWVRSLQLLARDNSALVAIPSALLASFLPILPLFALMALLSARTGSWKGMRYLASVAVVEGLSADAALVRSTQLAVTAGSDRGARMLTIVTSGIAGGLGGVAVVLLTRLLPGAVAMGMLSVFFALAWVLVAPLFAVINALAYLRARRSLGEPLDKALADFERAVLPESHWKLAERERVATLIASRW